MKLLHNQKTGKVRVLMRREQVLKICANHNIRSDMELTPKNDRAWMWAALDFADEEVRLEQLCVRFKTSDEAASFKDAFDKAKAIVAAAETSPVKAASSVTSASTPALTPEPTKTATKVVTPPVLSVPVTSPSNKITVGGFTFASPPTFKTDSKYSAAETFKDATKDKEKTSVDGSRPSPFAGFSFTCSPKVSTSVESAVGTGSMPVSEDSRCSRTAPFAPKSVFANSTPDTVQVTPKASTETSQTSGTKLMFDSPHTDLSFSALAAGNKELGFKKDDNFKGWEGAGQSVFGRSPKSEGINETEDGAEEFVPTAEFKPVIPLPELVEQKTGEEGETILFEERAKLLRFDSEGKQWKERGVGRVKITQDPTTGRVRLLMRREQVLKVCCNHFVTANMKFTASSSSDRAWTWYAQDYSEGEMKPELFAIRFKTVDQALSFKKTLDEVQTKMSEKGENTDKSTVQHAKLPQAMVWKCKECLFPNASDANQCLSCKIPRPRQFQETSVFVTHGSDQLPKVFELSKSTEPWVCQSCCVKNNPDIDKCMGCKKLKSSKADNVSSASEVKPLSELFKAKPGSWECKTCYIRNAGTADLCVACETPKPGSSATSKPVPSFSFTAVPKSDQNAVPLSELFKPKAGSWDCKECYAHNDADKTSCVCCSNPKPGHEVTQKEKTAISANQPLFKFGMPSPGTEFNFGISSQITTGQSDFTFGVTARGTPEPVKYNFGMPVSSTSTSTTLTTTTTTPSLFTSSNSATPKGGFSFGVPSTTASSVTSIFGADSTSAAKPFSFEPKPATGTFSFGSSSGGGTGNTNSLTFSFGSSTMAETSEDSISSKDTAGEEQIGTSNGV
jgi:E3 SUMO-protein ligase RanBP2